jgi:hypothetical protein
VFKPKTGGRITFSIFLDYAKSLFWGKDFSDTGDRNLERMGKRRNPLSPFRGSSEEELIILSSG